MLAAVYSSQTINGAEGIYLDEILGRRGVFRKDASAGTGYATVISDGNAPWATIVDTSYVFQTFSGKQYKPSSSQLLNQRVSAYTVTKTAIQAAGATVTFYVTDVNDGNLYSQAFTTSSPTLMADIATFFIAHTDASDSANIFIDTNTLYIGYLSTDLVNAVGLNAPTQIYSDKSIGTKHSDINVTAVETGYNEVLVGDIVNVTPTLTFGYVGVTNLTEFFAGSEVETDAEYRDRFNSVLDEATAATRSAIFKRVSDLANVEKVKIYDNPTDTPTAETGAFSFNVVVVGGETSEIATAIYETKPINTLTDGTTTYVISTEDGSTENIKFTFGDEVPYNVKVTYITVNGQPLSAAEQTAISTNIVNLVSSFTIAGTVYNAQLQSAVFSAIGFTRLSSLTVYTKLTTDGDGSYTTANITPAFDEVVSILSTDIIYEQTF